MRDILENAILCFQIMCKALNRVFAYIHTNRVNGKFYRCIWMPVVILIILIKDVIVVVI